MGAETREALVGQTVAGSWTVERELGELGGILALFARGVESGRAFLFVLPDDAPDPVLDEAEAARWGTTRRVLRDDALGRVVVDEVPDGPLLADRLELGVKPGAGLIEQLAQRVRACHRAGGAHGQLSPDRIVLGHEDAVAAGWGLGGEHVEQRKGRDLACLSRLTALAGPARRPSESGSFTGVQPQPAPAPAPAQPQPEPQEDGNNVSADPAPALTGPVTSSPGSTARLQAAIVADHAPTLAQALADWEAGGGSADDPTALRARDALARLHKKIEGCLAEARRRLSGGDPLGAVGPCREAVRLGAEAEAEPLLREARRQARQIVATPRSMPSPRVLALAGGGVLGVLLLVAALVLALRSDAGTKRLRSEMDAFAGTRGDRAAVIELVARHDRGDRSHAIEELLAERLARLHADEQEKAQKLSRSAVARGAQPREANRLAESALADLKELADAGADAPGMRARLQQVFLMLDRAAGLYRAASGLGAIEAARGAEALLAADPVFGGSAGAAGEDQ